MSNSLDLREITEQQGSGKIWGLLIDGMNWNIFYQPIAFIIFL
jgi:NADH-quinone oxidoreductase subunit H